MTYAPRQLRYTWRGPTPTPDQLTTLRRGMAEDGNLTRDTALLIDMRQLTTLPSFEDLHIIMSQARADGILPRAVAFVARPPEQFGVGRQSEMLLPPGVRGAVFSAEADALEWLGF